MKKFLLSAFIVLTFIFYSILDRLSAARRLISSLSIQTSNTSPSPLPSSPIVSDTPTISSALPTRRPTAAPTSVPAPTAVGLYKNGQYTGSPADAFYGTVQVKAIVSGGVITDVQFLSYPSDRSHSIEINTYAMPLLTSEAIQSQNANVNIVSGATATSDAFIQSLQSALSQAKT